jgi:hypothetical protein
MGTFFLFKKRKEKKRKKKYYVRNLLHVKFPANENSVFIRKHFE